MMVFKTTMNTILTIMIAIVIILIQMHNQCVWMILL